ncbi:SDR family oxidoreductase [Chitinophaga sp.]|uniref:enoyl-ACP reductase FabI n=1 Tax=Chitinophaga sp. TaxID=1869181 RepID=UPI0031DC4095
MANEFSDHHYWAIILGGSSGLGLAAAQKLAAHGMHLCIVHRDPGVEMEKVNTAFEGLRSRGVQVLTFNADVTRADKRAYISDALQNGMGAQGKVRCMVHSIARGTLKAMLPEGESGSNALSTDDFRITLDSMAYSLYDWVKDLSHKGLFAADARVLSFTSEGSHRAWKHYGAVSAAKAALEAISRNIALEFAPLGIRSNCIQAGTTNTRSLQLIPGSEQLIAWSEARNPFQRLTTPEDVANVVYLLCKDEAAWINGAIIPVDGGAHIC